MGSYNRTLILVVSKTNTQLMTNISLMLSTNDVNKIIDKCNSNLKCFLKGGCIPHVNIKKDIVDLAKNCQFEQVNFEELRLLIHDNFGNIPLNGINEEKNTHTIEVCASTDGKDLATYHQYDLCVVVDSTKQVSAIIEDVILDIQMFHFYDLDSEFSTIGEKRAFSEKKMNFCKELISYYNAVENNYCSLASYCRDEKLNLDYKEYCNLWGKFYKQLTSSAKDVNKVRSVDELVDYIISNHIQGKQISRRKLQTLIKKECVNNGKYTLVRWSKRPKTRKEAKKIKVLLKGKWVHVGKIIIIPSSDRYCYKNNEEYFSLFDFYYSGSSMSDN